MPYLRRLRLDLAERAAQPRLALPQLLGHATVPEGQGALAAHDLAATAAAEAGQWKAESYAGDAPATGAAGHADRAVGARIATAGGLGYPGIDLGAVGERSLPHRGAPARHDIVVGRPVPGAFCAFDVGRGCAAREDGEKQHGTKAPGRPTLDLHTLPPGYHHMRV